MLVDTYHGFVFLFETCDLIRKDVSGIDTVKRSYHAYIIIGMRQ